MPRLVLWDIDGTLVRTHGVASNAFTRTIAAHCGVDPELVSMPEMAGKTDRQIVVEWLPMLGMTADDEAVDSILTAFESELALVSAEIAKKGMSCPGAAEALEALDQRGVIQTVCTGNIPVNAKLKLASFGLDRWLDLEVGAYGIQHVDRRDLVPLSLARLEELRAVQVDRDDVWVVGDTPRDLACARAAGVHCLLVGTGTFSAEQLGEAGADSVLADLSDTDTVVKLLAS